jgi:Flp pilus assembly protein TadD
MTAHPSPPPDAETPDTLMAAAVAAQRGGDGAAAERLYRAFLEAHGPRPEVLNNLAGLRYQAGDWDEAAALYVRTVESGARHPAVYANLARAHLRRAAPDRAAAAFEQALALDPHDASVWNDLGNARFALDDLSGAAKAYERALRHRPAFARALNNLGNTRRAQGDIEAAVAAYTRACGLLADDDPDAGEIHTNRAHALLLAGRWAEGFAAYAWRWRKPGVAAPLDPGTPPWRGEPLAGRRILMVAEQGFGDSILGLRFAQVLTRDAAWVGFIGPAALSRLAEHVTGIDAVFDADETPAAHDVHVLAMDLPGLLGATPDGVPGAVPYVGVAGPARRTPGPLRVGLAWAGNPAQVDDAARSFGFAALDPVLAVGGVDFVALQVGPRAADAALDPRVRDGVAGAADFLDTAQVIAGLDLVIAVDSAVAHLAGAMECPVWVPLTRIPDWRYGLEGDRSAFFPSMRLYRQETRGDWSAPMARVAADLRALVA